MQHRFRFLARPDSTLKTWYIEGDELFHLKKVLRLKGGAEVEVFDANGHWAIGHIKDLSTDFALVNGEESFHEQRQSPKLALACGALQQQTMAELIPCLVELGIDEIHIFLQEGSAKARLADKSLNRWNKIALSALKQCKRSYQPLIRNWNSLEECLKAVSKDYEMVFLEPEAEKPLSHFPIAKTKPVMIFLGSEKGLNSEEIKKLQQAGAQSANLGNSILRSFTAAIAAASLLLFKRSDL